MSGLIAPCGGRGASGAPLKRNVKLIAEPFDPKEVVSIEELTISNMYEIEALMEVLIDKGIVSKEGVLEEIRR